MPDIDKIKFDKNTFKKLERVGGGHYTDVYKGVDLRNDQTVAMKIMKNLEEKGQPEMSGVYETAILQALKGGPNIVEFIAVVRNTMN